MNSGNGYINYFCTQTKHFLFDIEVTKETIKKFNHIYFYSWFDLKNKTYHKAWSECPEETLKQFAAISEFQTTEARSKFKEITGLVLPSA